MYFVLGSWPCFLSVCPTALGNWLFIYHLSSLSFGCPSMMAFLLLFLGCHLCSSIHSLHLSPKLLLKPKLLTSYYCLYLHIYMYNTILQMYSFISFFLMVMFIFFGVNNLFFLIKNLYSVFYWVKIYFVIVLYIFLCSNLLWRPCEPPWFWLRYVIQGHNIVFWKTFLKKEIKTDHLCENVKSNIMSHTYVLSTYIKTLKNWKYLTRYLWGKILNTSATYW